MIKIRLHGTKNEIDKFILFLENQKSVTILTQSPNYADRGKSKYERCYLDVKLDEVQDESNN